MQQNNFKNEVTMFDKIVNQSIQVELCSLVYKLRDVFHN